MEVLFSNLCYGLQEIKDCYKKDNMIMNQLQNIQKEDLI